MPVGGASCDHTHSTGVQTEEGGGVVTLAEKLRELDEHHLAQLEEQEEGEGVRGEVREEWRRECEETLRKEMERKMEQFR